MNFNIELQGGAELEKTLEELPLRAQNRVMKPALLDGAGVIAGLARQFVHIGHPPLPKGHDPGDLQAAITASARIRRGVPSARVFVDKAKAFYARFIEFGTRHARAFPFMRPAADEGAETAAQTIVDSATARADELVRQGTE